MTLSPPPSRLKLFKRAMPMLVLALSAGFVSAPAWAQAPRAGTSIGNQATATYNDGSAIARSVQSNSVVTTVQQVAAVKLTDPRTISAAPGAPVNFPHTIQNNGNGVDSFNITVVDNGGDDFDVAPVIYADANQDGVPDNNTPITRTPSLQPGEKFNFVVVGRVPNTQTAAQTATLTVATASVATPGITDSNVDTVRVSTNAVVTLLKSLDKNSGTSASNPFTYTLRYTNNSNTTATNVTITDLLNPALNYNAGSGRWSASGGTALTDAAAGDPTGIDYSYDAGSRTITAVVASVPARTTGSVTFTINLASNARPGIIPNTANLSYNDGAATRTDTSNNVDLTVTQAASLTFTGQNKGTVPQGSTVTFVNPLTNTGNGVDTFDITFNPGNSFPAGTTFQLFKPDSTGLDGAATLLDTNGNGIPDTGPLQPGAVYNVIVKAILPPTFAGTGPYNVVLTGASNGTGKPTAQATDIVNAITASAAEITNRDATNTRIGQGDLTATPVLIRTTNPGTVVTFPLSANNKSARDDNYALSFSAVNPGATVLPPGFSVVFRDGANNVITNTGNIAAGGFFDYVAEVTVPANASPQDLALFFTITSGASGATDTIRDRVTVNTVRALTITPNNQGQVFPGSSVNYAHTVTNNGNADEVGVTLSTTDNGTGFSSVTYLDANGDGILSQDEQNAGPLTTLPTLAPGANAKVIVQVFGPSNQFTSGAVNTTTLTATAVGTGAPVASATDTTTIVAGDVVLTKTQSVNGAAATQSNVTALPGSTITYSILVRNTGGAPVTNVVVSDTIPSFTTYSTTPAPASYSVNGGAAVTTGVAAPDNGGTGTITWTIPTIAANSSAVVTFSVTINK